MARKPKKQDDQIPTEERRKEERRKQEAPVAVERRKVQRRRQIDPTTCERDYSGREIEFMQALDAYKRRTGNNFPDSSEILGVLLSLGYERTSTGPAAAAPNLDEIVDEVTGSDDFDAVEEAEEATA